MKTPFLGFVLGIAFLAIAASAGTSSADVDFQREVQPILKQYCSNCHGTTKQQGGLRFDSSEGAVREGDSGEPAIMPGQPDKSELIRRVSSDDENERMPPDEAALGVKQIDVLRRWIKEGARWPSQATTSTAARQELVVTDTDRQHWAFMPLRAVELPEVKMADWVRTPIDQFILAAFEANQFEPAPPADSRKLIRRVYFEVIGLPPTPEQVQTAELALRNESSRSQPGLSNSAYESLVDRLLNSQHFGERWGRHWLDVARYADSNGQEGDQDRPGAYHYRNFVIRALNEDLPFDTFVRWQLAGDEIDPDNPLAVAATGFLTAGPNTLLMVPMEDEKLRNRYNELDDMLSTIGTGLLGLTIGCARCHDHKFDAIPTRDYYRMLSAVHNGDRAEVPLASRGELADFQRRHDQWDKQLESAESRLNDWLKTNKQPLESKLRETKINALPIGDSEKALLRDNPGGGVAKTLAKQHEQALRISDDEIRRAISDDQRRRWDELAGEITKIRGREPQPPPMAHAFRDFGPQPQTTWLFQRADFYDRDEPVPLGFLSVLTSGKTPEDYLIQASSERPLPGSSYQRKAMAEWITDTQHGAGALLARVIVNRVWQHYFGEGLVRTVSDFGVQGERPSHPDLLEWLTHDFVSNGWQPKRLHRMILTSAAYQQAGISSAERAASDSTLHPAILMPMSPRRLEAEILRDSMLAVSGKLNPQPYGPAFKPPIAAEAMVARNLKDPYPANIKQSPDTLRRSVYMFHKRVVPYPLLQAFDAPDAQQACGRRDRTTVAPQALALFNDQFVRDRSLDFAQRLLREAGDQDAPCVVLGYQLAFSRSPTSTELAACEAFIRSQQERRKTRDPQQADVATRRQALADFCQTLFSLNEFIYVD